MNQTIEYMVIGKRIDKTIFGRKYFTNKQKALEYKKALENKYPHLKILILEI